MDAVKSISWALFFWISGVVIAQACDSRSGPIAQVGSSWVVVKSANPSDPQDVSDLLDLYQTLLPRWSCAEILRSQNGFLALAIGTVPEADGPSLLQDWIRSGRIPADSFLSKGNKLVARVPASSLRSRAAQVPTQSTNPAQEQENVNIGTPSLPTSGRYDRQALKAKFNRDRSRRIDRQLDSILASLNSDRRSGIVYKSEGFWGRYPNFQVVRAIFDGNWSSLPGEYAFAQVYYNYVDAAYSVCRHSLQGKIYNFRVTELDENDIPTRNGEVYYVEMTEEFARHYERFYNRRKRGQALATLGAIGRALIDKDAENPFTIPRHILTEVADIEIFNRAMHRFLADQGCRSATVQQLERNILNLAGNQAPVQQQSSYRFAGAESESDPFTRADARAYLDRVRRMIAANPFPESKGHLLLDEELEDHDHYFLRDYKPRNEGARKISRDMEESGVLMLRCIYGPTGFLRDGVSYDTVEYIFTYAQEPPQFAGFKAGYVSISEYQGWFHVVSACPPDSAQALALAKSPVR